MSGSDAERHRRYGRENRMNIKKPVIMIAAGVLCMIGAVIWMIAVMGSVNWYMIPAYIGGKMITEGIIDLKS